MVLGLLKQLQGQQGNPSVNQMTELVLNLGVQVLSFDPRGFAVEDESTFEHVDLPRGMQPLLEGDDPHCIPLWLPNRES